MLQHWDIVTKSGPQCDKIIANIDKLESPPHKILQVNICCFVGTVEKDIDKTLTKDYPKRQNDSSILRINVCCLVDTMEPKVFFKGSTKTVFSFCQHILKSNTNSFHPMQTIFTEVYGKHTL